MRPHRIIKIIKEKLMAFGFDTPESIDAMSSVSYLAIIVELEEVFGVEFPDELLSENAFHDVEKLATTVQNLLPKGGLSMFKNIRIVSKKKYIHEDIRLNSDEENRVRLFYPGRAYFPLYAAYLIASYMTLRIDTFFRVESSLKEILSTNVLPTDATISRKLLITGIMLAILMLCATMTTVLHESLHIITYPRNAKNATLSIVVRFPLSVTLIYDKWRTKRNLVFSNLCPIISLSIVTLCCALLVKNPFADFILSVIFILNLFGSVSDVINTIFILIKVPKNSMLRGGYILLPNISQEVSI
jgi:acyl carrier protein